MKVIDHLLAKLNSVTLGDVILYPVAVVTAIYAFQIVTIVLE
jgi:hypothetical protein